MVAEEKNQSRKKLIVGIIVYALMLLGIVFIINLEAVNAWLAGVLLLLRPILIGLALAYLCNPFFRFFERRLLSHLRPQGLRRTIALILTYLTAFLIVALILLLIVPRLIESIVEFLEQYDQHLVSGIGQLNKMIANVNGFIERLTQTPDTFAYLHEATLLKNVTAWVEENIPLLLNILSDFDIKSLTDVFGGAVSMVTDALFGLFISIYLLASKEKRYAQVMKLRRALFSSSVNQRITELCRTADRSFGGFIEGKLLDSLIIGLLTYVVISFAQIPYAILIATFVGLTNIVPVIGPIIGAVPTALILLLTDPAKVIPFLIIILIIQQIDGNIIGPKILGSNTGVSSLCVVIAIATMGSLWGLLGMILGVPLFATVLEVTDRFVIERLQKKGMPAGLENYYSGDAIVDPAKNAYSTTDKTVQSLERRALQARKKQESGVALSRKERFLIWGYNLSHKYHVINEISDEGQVRFAAENAALEAEARATEQARTRLEENHTPVEADTVTDV